MEKIDIKSLTLDEVTELIVSWGEKSFRGKQIYQWIHEKLADSFLDMTNLSAQLQKLLMERCELAVLSTVEVKTSNLDGTKKFLFSLSDGHVIESVLMKYKHGNSVCISSQVGCKMGCRFCASTLDGLARNLKPSEMLDQIYRIQKTSGERVSNVVVMGVGEPMDNYDNLIRFIRLLTDKNGLNISQRNITVSTCGIVPEMKRLSEEGLQITLALSLHAPNDQVRRQLMPVANRFPLSEVLNACENYFQKTGRRVTFEYSLVRGVNDNKEEAKALSQLLKGKSAHVNLIPVNPIKERDYVQSDGKSIQNFKKLLENSGINVTIRREMGRDIGGACGQLRKSHIDQAHKTGG